MHEESLRLVIITAAAVTLFINKESGKRTTQAEREKMKRRKEKSWLRRKERGYGRGKGAGSQAGKEEIRVTKWRRPQHILPMASL